MKQGRRAQKFILPHWWTSVIWRMPNWSKAPKIQRSSCTPRRHCERWFWFSCSIYRTRIISITNDCSKSYGYHISDCQDAQDKQQTQYLLIPRKNGGCSKIIKNSKIGMSRHLDSSTTTQMAKIMVQIGRSSRSSRAESVRSSFGRTVMERQFEKILLKYGREKVSKWNAYSCTVKKGCSYVCMWMTQKLAGKKQNINPMWKLLNKGVDWENQHLSSIMCTVLKDNVK